MSRKTITETDVASVNGQRFLSEGLLPPIQQRIAERLGFSTPEEWYATVLEGSKRPGCEQILFEAEVFGPGTYPGSRKVKAIRAIGIINLMTGEVRPCPT